MSLALLCASALALTAAVAPAKAPAPLAERLGYRPTDRILIVNGDDVGMCHTANLATIDGMEHGLISSGTIMVPCPWFTEIARYAKAHPKSDFGIHLCHTAEWDVYRWGPVANRADVPGLIGPDGYLWPSIEEVYQHATPEEAEREGRAQIRMALAAGVDVTHIDSHMGTLQLDPRYIPVYVKLAREFNVPLRMASQDLLDRHHFGDLRGQCEAQGLVFPDYLIHEEGPVSEDTKTYWLRILRTLKPGVTELYIHAGLPTDELKAVTGSWATRSREHELFTTDPDVRQIVKELGIITIGYRPLRDLMRKGR